MILLDAGPSERGFSRLSAVKACPQLYAFRYRLTRRPGALPSQDAPIVPSFFSSGALTRGSLLHVGLAHYYERMRLETSARPGDPDPSELYEPEEAVIELGERMHAERVAHGTLAEEGDPRNFVEQIRAAIRRYSAEELHAFQNGGPSPWAKDIDGRLNPLAFNARPPAIVGVEQQLRAAIRRVKPGAGVPDHGDYTPFGRVLVRLLEDGEQPRRDEVLFTQRLDLMTWSETRGSPGVPPVGMLRVVDHKSTSMKKKGEQSPEVGYSMHGQFWGAKMLATLAAAKWWPGRKVAVNVQVLLLELNECGLADARVFAPEPAEFAEATFAEDVISWEEAIARWEAETASGIRDYWTWPRHGVETGCLGRYSRCHAWELCRRGPAWRPGIKLKEK